MSQFNELTGSAYMRFAEECVSGLCLLYCEYSTIGQVVRKAQIVNIYESAAVPKTFALHC
jgi:hypothetical protein